MSLFSALSVSVSGLSAQSAAISNISDNLANTATVGFKRVDTSFESLVTSSNSVSNDPGGVRAIPSYQHAIEGNLIPSQISTSLAISGQGFFAVSPAISDADGVSTFSSDTAFTRRGDFRLNNNGYIVNGGEFFLKGYRVSDTGEVDTSETTPIKIEPLIDSPVATTEVSYAANLIASAADGTIFPASSVKMFDTLGTPHNMNIVWTKNSTNNWTADITVPAAVAPVAPAILYTDFNISVPFVFNGAGVNAGTMQSITAGAGYTVIDNSAELQNFAQIEFDLSFEGAGTQSVTTTFGTFGSSSGTTQFADSAIEVSLFEQNGIDRGSYDDVSIDNNGFLAIHYDNGRSRTFYQIPIIQFFAQDRLQRVTGGAYQATIESGTPLYGAPGTLGGGTISSSSLEGSNVDIADEFTKLIQAQRIYSANARGVTTADSMLQEVINLIR